MRKLFLFALLATSICAFANSPKDKTVATEQKPAQTITEVPHMTTDMFLDKVFDFTKSKEWAYKGTTPMVIDLYATWCGPCRSIAPIVKELANDYKGKVQFYKVDVDKSKEIAQFFRAEKIPYMVFIPVTGEPQFFVGAAEKATYKRIIDQYLVPAKK